MSAPFAITAQWEHLERGSAEERACYAALGIRVGEHYLTTAHDTFVQRVRDHVHLSAYRMAEWLAWNWWRLRWEPLRMRPDNDWAQSHRMGTIGGGFVWPLIEVASDGEFITLSAEPSQPSPAEPLRYLSRERITIESQAWERGVDSFVEQVIGQLRAEAVPETNLDRIWAELRAERNDAAAAEQRRLEAQLGFDPDQVDESLLEGLITDAATVGLEAVSELATLRSSVAAAPTVSELREAAQAHGVPTQAPTLDVGFVRAPPSISPPPSRHGWEVGADFAKMLRAARHMNGEPLGDEALAALGGVDAAVLHDEPARTSVPLAFTLADEDAQDRLVLRSRWHEGRRFELARLIGDRAFQTEAQLRPATQMSTYRQKVQRAFAAHLLCPYDALEDLLKGDYSPEAQDDAARHFEVSVRTVQTQLVNHGSISRDILTIEPDRAA